MPTKAQMQAQLDEALDIVATLKQERATLVERLRAADAESESRVYRDATAKPQGIVTVGHVPGDWDRLRAEFPPEQVGKLPRYPRWLRDQFKAKKIPGVDCPLCHTWHPDHPAVVHLDYVGHATVTKRLNDVDPAWNWEPMSIHPQSGLPVFTVADGQPVGLWIRLTVLGVTRLGFGSVEAGVFDPEKQLIGDAIRNAAMRFGVATSLWEKLPDETAEEQPAAKTPAPKPTEKRVAHPSSPSQTPDPFPPEPMPVDGPPNTEAVVCRKCGVEHPAANTFPSKFPLREYGLPAGYPIFKCQDCGQYSPAQPPGDATVDPPGHAAGDPGPMDSVDSELPF